MFLRRISHCSFKRTPRIERKTEITHEIIWDFTVQTVALISDLTNEDKIEDKTKHKNFVWNEQEGALTTKPLLRGPAQTKDSYNEPIVIVVFIQSPQIILVFFPYWVFVLISNWFNNKKVM